jgi:UDP-N-acetylmuramoyl-tripeptide--D-alanyl-D-alanine ligase
VRWRVNGVVELHLPIPGVHNAANGTAAYAVARHFGMDDAAIAAAMATFRAAEMRLSTRRFGSLTVIDDCYNANPASMAAGIEVLAAAPGTRRVLVAGEMRELGVDSQRLHRSVGERAAGAGIDVLAGVGAGARDILDAARVHRSVETYWYPDAATAAPEIARWAQPDDVILVKGSRAVGLERVVQALAASGGMEDGTKRVEAVVAPSGPA